MAQYAQFMFAYAGTISMVSDISLALQSLHGILHDHGLSQASCNDHNISPGPSAPSLARSLRGAAKP